MAFHIGSAFRSPWASHRTGRLASDLTAVASGKSLDTHLADAAAKGISGQCAQCDTRR
jgi:hypothetical protein